MGKTIKNLSKKHKKSTTKYQNYKHDVAHTEHLKPPTDDQQRHHYHLLNNDDIAKK